MIVHAEEMIFASTRTLYETKVFITHRLQRAREIHIYEIVFVFEPWSLYSRVIVIINLSRPEAMKTITSGSPDLYASPRIQIQNKMVNVMRD